jgi:hypothetical protein
MGDLRAFKSLVPYKGVAFGQEFLVYCRGICRMLRPYDCFNLAFNF